MSKTETSPFDVAEHLRTPEEMAAYLEATFEEADGDVTFIARALDDVACACAQGREELSADFESLAGIWRDRKNTQESIRKKAWLKKK